MKGKPDGHPRLQPPPQPLDRSHPTIVNDRLYLIVNRRYESGKPVLVTTNMDLAQLTDKLGERTISRLCEMCHSLPPFPDEDYRKKHMR